jgi:transposase-like protein
MDEPHMTTTTPPEIPVDQEVDAGTRRRTFTAAYKAKILAEADAATEAGAIGALLRREGLYSSHLVDWRRRRAEGASKGLEPRPVGRPPKSDSQRAEAKEIARLQGKVTSLELRLRQAEIIIEAQKKLAEVLGLLTSPTTGTCG